MNLLILTTMLHYFAITPFTKYNNYIRTIIISTTLSILWHLNNEPYGILLFLDYTAAVIWTIYDLYLADRTNNFFVFGLAISYNFIIFSLHFLIIYKKYYIITHSIWHILSAIKSYYVSKLIKENTYDEIL